MKWKAFACRFHHILGTVEFYCKVIWPYASFCYWTLVLVSFLCYSGLRKSLQLIQGSHYQRFHLFVNIVILSKGNGKGNYQWTDGTSFNPAVYNNWDTNEPDNQWVYSALLVKWFVTLISNNIRQSYLCSVLKLSWQLFEAIHLYLILADKVSV